MCAPQAVVQALAAGLPLATGCAVPASHPLVGTCILVVEDDPASARLAGAMLTRAGANVQFAQTGRGALALVLAGFRPSAVVMDLQMPDGDGVDAIRMLRTWSPTRAVPIIATSSSASGRSGADALKAGADAFTPKPLDPDALPQLIVRHLGARP
jgi:CheY-like chemotaxis protein